MLKRLLIILPLLLVLGLSGLIWISIDRDPPTTQERVDYDLREVISRPLPGLVDTQIVEVSDWLQANETGERVLIVNFFASWCVPCRAEHPKLMQLANDPRVKVLGIGYKDSPENLQAFLDQLGDPYQSVLVDLEGRGGIDWGITGVPETFVLANGSQIVGKIAGPLVSDVTLERFESLINVASTVDQ